MKEKDIFPPPSVGHRPSTVESPALFYHNVTISSHKSKAKRGGPLTFSLCVFKWKTWKKENGNCRRRMEKAVGALRRTERTNETTNVAAFKSPPLQPYPISHEQREPVSLFLHLSPQFYSWVSVCQTSCKTQDLKSRPLNYSLIVGSYVTFQNRKWQSRNLPTPPLHSSVPSSPKTRENPSTMWRISLRASSGLNFRKKKKNWGPNPKRK
jgi:hypothetical protein